MKTERKSNYPILPLILHRWSPRSMTGEELKDEEILPLFEAARWAPSSYNEQPWCFLFAKRNTEHWHSFFNLLVPFNQEWCKNAALLGIILARTSFAKNQKPSVTFALDAGAAWENLFLQGVSQNLVVHGMQGFDYEKARKSLLIPDLYAILAMFAVGKKAPKEKLSEELQKRETPSSRKELHEFVFEGSFPKKPREIA